MTVVSDEAVKAAAEEASKELVKPEPDPVPAVPAFSPHINHAALRMLRTRQEVETYDLGIKALRTELTGIEKSVNSDIARIEDDAADRIATIERETKDKVAGLKETLISEQSRLNHRIEDLELARDMLQAAVDVHQSRQPEEKADAETDPEPDPDRTGEDGGGAGQPGQ